MLPVGPIFKGGAYKKEDGTGRLSRIVGKIISINAGNIPDIMKFVKEWKKDVK